jgi:hypothetical protein
MTVYAQTEAEIQAELDKWHRRRAEKNRIGSSAEEFLKQPFPEKEPLITNLVHRRDLIALGARRRHGKTSFTTHMAVALAVPEPEFLGYQIPEARRSLLLMLEDDSGEYQEKLKVVVGGRDLGGRLRIMTRDYFLDRKIRRDIDDGGFREVVRNAAEQHKPDLIVFDNLAHLIGAEYNDAKRMHDLMTFCYDLAKAHNSAIILAAHPRKEDPQHPLNLRGKSNHFFESIMGSSHFINSTGSIWGLERPEGEDYSVFLGGRQRGDGTQQVSIIQMDENRCFQVVPDAQYNLQLVLNTPARQQAWKCLPDAPRTFGYREGEEMVKAVMKSSSTYNAWMRECRRLRVIVDAPDGKLLKAPELAQPRRDYILGRAEPLLADGN